MKKFIIATVITLACIFGLFGLYCGISTMEGEPPFRQSTTIDTSAEEDRLHYTYTISSVAELSKGDSKVYQIRFEERTLTKVRATGLTFKANEEFGSTLEVGQKLTVKEIEENLIY